MISSVQVRIPQNLIVSMAPPPQSDLTSSPRSLADKLIRASKFDTPGTAREDGRATEAARQSDTHTDSNDSK